MVRESTAGESHLADVDADTGFDMGHDRLHGQPRQRRKRVKVRRQEEKFPHALRIAIMIGAPTLLWIGIYLIARAVL